MTKKMIEYKPALMNISPPPCIAKEEGDVLHHVILKGVDGFGDKPS